MIRNVLLFIACTIMELFLFVIMGLSIAVFVFMMLFMLSGHENVTVRFNSLPETITEEYQVEWSQIFKDEKAQELLDEGYVIHLDQKVDGEKRMATLRPRE